MVPRPVVVTFTLIIHILKKLEFVPSFKGRILIGKALKMIRCELWQSAHGVRALILVTVSKNK